MKGYKASVTVFLSMIMLLLIGLVMCLIEVTKIHNMKVYRRVAAEGAIESVFAEYHMELQEMYGLFGLDASYRGSDFAEEKVLDRFDYYGGTWDEYEIETLQLMTDNHGASFLDQVIFYMKDATGLGFLEGILGMTQEWESIDIEEGAKGEEELTGLSDMKDTVSEDLENPLSSFLDFDFQGILNLVVEHKDSLSEGEVTLSELCSQRQRKTGYGSSVNLNYSDITTKPILVEYVMRILDNAGQLLSYTQGEEETVSLESSSEGEGNDTLQYQLEYLIGGKNSDQDNLKSVVHKLLLIRTPVNYACLKADSIKKAEVNVAAIAIAAAVGAVGTEHIIGESLLWAWSYGESMVDVRSLLSGGSLTLTKSSSQWQLELSNLLSFGNSSLPNVDSDEGMDYGEFLRILLYLESIETLTERGMDMVELGVRSGIGMEGFRLDYCISRIRLNLETQVGLGHSYSFPIEYGYR